MMGELLVLPSAFMAAAAAAATRLLGGRWDRGTEPKPPPLPAISSAVKALAAIGVALADKTFTEAVSALAIAVDVSGGAKGGRRSIETSTLRRSFSSSEVLEETEMFELLVAGADFLRLTRAVDPMVVRRFEGKNCSDEEQRSVSSSSSSMARGRGFFLSSESESSEIA